jgi:tRNA-uridine 2-sulfurtransferase
MDKQKVVVAMSGGVDSSVAAALMVEQGYDVTGIMLKLWVGNCDQQDNACCTPEAIQQARSIASTLDIPFYVIDAQDEFKTSVVDYFITASANGVTPNPCYVCNREIRWGFLFNKIRQLGADFLVTGHYAQINKDEHGQYHLRRGLDVSKDQSYVLSGLNQEQLSHTLFPLGGLVKTKVREMAKELKLVSASKPDSQDLCFIGNQSQSGFLKEYSELKPGFIKDKTGNVISRHSGMQNYTIGQRKGVGSGFSEPYYVIDKDPESGDITIGTKEALHFSSLLVHPLNWISGNKPIFPQKYSIKIRYKAPAVGCELFSTQKDLVMVELDKSVRDATPGQIAVFYIGDEVIGSGEIIRNKGILS